MEELQKKKIEFKYINEKRLGIYDFVESIKTDLIKKISKNRGFIDEFVGFRIWWEYSAFCFPVNIKKFGFESLPTDEFVSALLSITNYNYRECLEEEYYDMDDDFFNDFIIDSMEIIIYTDAYKILHKQKFLKDLHDEIMGIAWHPNRFQEWCLDTEELKGLKERWVME